MMFWQFLHFQKHLQCASTVCLLVAKRSGTPETVIAATIAVTSIGSKNQHSGELPNSNKKLKNRLRTSIEAKYVHFVSALYPL